MENSLLTKCPHCQTLFRIQNEHLAAAEGDVRCGVCFKVFNASSEGVICGEEEHTEPTGTSKTEAAKQAHQLPAETIQTAPTKQQPPDRETIGNLIIEEETVEELLAARATGIKLEKPWLWGSLSLLGLLMLATQWLWFNRDLYASLPEWRPWYETACRHLPCSLREYKAPELIKAERIAVKSHPEFGDALRVELIIRNLASHPQPLPAIEITFFDLNGTAVAYRSFNPTEYSSKLESNHKMEIITPYHLSFSIIDPGERAANYRVNFSSAK